MNGLNFNQSADLSLWRKTVANLSLPITICPSCHEEQIRKVFSAVPIEFKGHGFYRTDSGSGKGSK
jgi:predicted nucleic acid-binding Zn ribbon protein